jgi:hypothetical protein
MIQPLRTAHRRAFVGLAVILPTVLIVGLSARRFPQSVPGNQSLPSRSEQLIKTSDALWRMHSIRTEFYRDTLHPKQFEVVLHSTQELNEPDLLLYWSPASSNEFLPTDALLLGEFESGKAFSLPGNPRQGRLILFSLPHQAVVDAAQLEKLP